MVDLVIHLGKIREKLSGRGYYISQLGLIKEKESDEYSPGEIRYTRGIFYGKEEVIVSEKETEEKTRLIQILTANKIPYQKAKIQTESHFLLKKSKAKKRLEKIEKNIEKNKSLIAQLGNQQIRINFFSFFDYKFRSIKHLIASYCSMKEHFFSKQVFFLGE
jgi:hypothetical protein